jgi:hypothetical protein
MIYVNIAVIRLTFEICCASVHMCGKSGDVDLMQTVEGANTGLLTSKRTQREQLHEI